VMKLPWLTLRAAEADRAIAYAEGTEDGRRDAMNDILPELMRLNLRIDSLEKELEGAPDCDKCDRLDPEDLAQYSADRVSP